MATLKPPIPSGLSAREALDAVPDGWAKLDGKWVQVGDAVGYTVHGPLGQIVRARVLVAPEGWR